MSSEQVILEMMGDPSATATGSLTVQATGYVPQQVVAAFGTGSPQTVTLQKAKPLYWNAKSQTIADLFVQYGYNPFVKLSHDIFEPGCTDYVGGEPCDGTYWPSSDNYPPCLALQDYGHGDVGAAMLATATALHCLDPTHQNFGNRYEVYMGILIKKGNPTNQHTLLLPPDGSSRMVAIPPNYDNTKGAPPWGKTPDGKPYKIQQDAYFNVGNPTPNPDSPIDVAAPQAVRYWLVGDKANFMIFHDNIVKRYSTTGYVNTGSMWQLGQTMLLKRLAGTDTDADWQAMEAMLWSNQLPSGLLPNSYYGTGKPGAGHDPENQNAGLMPYSATIINNLKSLFGKFAGQ